MKNENVIDPIDARAIANWFIKKSLDHGIAVSPLRLVKLVYIANGYCHGLLGCPLITEVTWVDKYGPIILSIKQQFVRKNGNNDLQSVSYLPGINNFGLDEIEENEYIKQICQFTWDRTKDKPIENVQAMCYQKGSPYNVAKEKWGEGCSIPNDLLKQYYSELFKVN